MKVTKSHISVANAPTRIDVPERQLENEYKIHLKRGRSIGSKDITPRNRRKQRKIGVPKKANIKQKAYAAAYGEQKALIESYGEQEAPVKSYIEQETLAKV